MTAPVSPVSAEDLKCCPFCSAEPLLQEIAPHTHNIRFGDLKMPDHQGSWTIECPACECGMIADTRENVTSSWNRRATAPSGAKVPEWLPIETAPKDGTEFDVWCQEDSPPENGYRVADCWWCSADQKIRTYGDERRGWASQPTHWMLRPAAPAPPDTNLDEGE